MSPPAGALPACRHARSTFSCPPSEHISLGVPPRPWPHDRRGHNPTDNSRTLLIPSPPWLLLLCNICFSLGGGGWQKGGRWGGRGCKLPGIPFRISMIREAIPPAITFFIKSVWYWCFSRALWFLLCVCVCVNAPFSMQSTQGRPLHVL